MTQPPLHQTKPRATALPAPLWLDNGTELDIFPIPEAYIVRLTITFRGGRWMESKVLQSTLAANLMTAGTTDMSAERIAQQLDFYGASINISAGIQSTILTMTCLRRNLAQVMPILRDIISAPAYEEQQMDIEKDEFIFASRANKQNVSYVSQKLLQRTLLGEAHPLAQSYDETDVEALTHDDIATYHSRLINMANAVIYASGDVDDEVVSLINRHLGTMPADASAVATLPRIDTKASSQQRHDAVIETESAQSAINIGTLMPTRVSPDYPAIALTRTILGGYFGSRLMSNIRERLGLTYGISADMLHMPGSALLLISSTTTRKHVDKCVEEIFKEVERLQTEPVGDDEMTIAKNYLMGQYCRTTEMTLSLPSVCIVLRESGSSLKEHAKMMEQIQALTPADIMDCARHYLQTSSMHIAAAHGKEEPYNTKSMWTTTD